MVSASKGHKSFRLTRFFMPLSVSRNKTKFLLFHVLPRASMILSLGICSFANGFCLYGIGMIRGEFAGIVSELNPCVKKS